MPGGDLLAPEAVAEAYTAIASVAPHVPRMSASAGGLGDLPLVRTVDPRQHAMLQGICARQPDDSPWHAVRRSVWEQRGLRERVNAHLRSLDEEREAGGDDFVFPDPHSLLLWLWTRYAFERTYVGPPTPRSRFVYRGEARDYGATRFRPSLSRRDGRPPAGEPAALRARLWEHFGGLPRGAAGLDTLVRYLTDTMSCAQAIAVAQHYGVATPLLDVTINPEVAMYFATMGAPGEDGIAVVGVAELPRENVAADDSPWPYVSLIAAPPAFTRIHMQSGFFLCMPDDASVPPFRVLRFRRPDARTFLPRWVAMTRAPVPSVQALLEDPLEVENALGSGVDGRHPSVPDRWPDPATVLGSSAPLSDDRLIQWALDSVIGAAGRVGCTEDGKRYVDVDAGGYYVLNRFAPIHGFIQTLVLQHLASRGAAFVAVVEMARAVAERLTLAVLEDMAGEPVMVDDPFAVAGHVILNHVDDRVPWPLSTWYPEPPAAPARQDARQPSD
jgi:hypothetical protein